MFILHPIVQFLIKQVLFVLTRAMTLIATSGQSGYRSPLCRTPELNEVRVVLSLGHNWVNTSGSDVLPSFLIGFTCDINDCMFIKVNYGKLFCLVLKQCFDVYHPYLFTQRAHQYQAELGLRVIKLNGIVQAYPTAS